MWDLGIYAFAYHLTLTSVDELAHFQHRRRRAHVPLLVASTTCARDQLIHCPLKSSLLFVLGFELTSSATTSKTTATTRGAPERHVV